MILSSLYLLFFTYVTRYSLVFGICLIILTLPSYQIRFSVLGIPTTLLELQIYLLFFLWVFLKQKKRLSGFLSIGLILFLLSGILSVFASPDTRAALGLFKAYVFDPVLFFLVAHSVLTTKHLKYIVLSLTGLVLYVSSYAILQYLHVFSSPEPWISEIPPRVTSVFAYPNAVGLLLAPVLIYLTIEYFQKKGSWIQALSILLGFTALLMTFSRGAIISAIVILGVYGLMRRIWPIIIGLAVCVMVLPVSPMAQNELSGIVNITDTSTDVRITLWQGTSNLLLHQPLTGAGLAGFPITYEQYKETKHTELLQYPHNLFMDLWVELGLLGMLTFYAILFYAFFIAAKNNNTTMIYTLTTYTVYGLIDSPYFKNDLVIVFWLLITLSLMTSTKNSLPKKVM